MAANQFQQINFSKSISANQWQQINFSKSISANQFQQINFSKSIIQQINNSANQFQQINFSKSKKINSNVKSRITSISTICQSITWQWIPTPLKLHHTT